MNRKPALPRVTLGDVARHANVSETTASHVMTGARPVAERTRVKVLQSVQALGYRPNLVAKALRSQKTQMVTVIVPDISNTSYTASIRGASQYLLASGYSTTIVDTADHVPSEREMATVLDGMPTGVIFLGLGPDSGAESALIGGRVPFVVGGLGKEPRKRWDVVYTDQRAAVAAVSQRLAESSGSPGCFFGGDTGDEGAKARLQGYLQGLEAAGFSSADGCVELIPYSIEGGESAMREHRDNPPAWVIAGNDLIGVGAILAAQAQGLRVPEDIEVVGFDNVVACEAVNPSLSSIDVQLHKQGQDAADILIKRMENAISVAPVKHRVDTLWIPRNSTR